MHHCFLFIVTYLLSLGGKSTQQTSSVELSLVWTGRQATRHRTAITKLTRDPRDVENREFPAVDVFVDQSGGALRAIASDSARNRIIFQNFEENYLGVFDLLTNKTSRYFNNMVNNVEELAFDWLARNLYWSDSARQLIMVVDSSMTHYAVARHFPRDEKPYGLALHPTRRMLFFSIQTDEGSLIMRSDLSLSNAEVVMTSPQLDRIISIAVDGNRLYWVEFQRSFSRTMMSSLDGSERRILKSGQREDFHGVASFMGTLYVTDTKQYMDDEVGSVTSYAGGIYYKMWMFSSESNSQTTFPLNQQPRKVTFLTNDPSYLRSQASFDGECDSPGVPPCDHICLPRLNATRQCVCAIGYRKVGETGCTADSLNDDVVLVVDEVQKKIFQIPISTSTQHSQNVLPIASEYDRRVTTMALNQNTRVLYWSDEANSTIYKLPYNSNHPQVVRAGMHAASMAVDPLTGNVYFSDKSSGFIYVMTENGDFLKTMLQRNRSARKMLVDFVNRHLYWLEPAASYYSPGSIQRMNLSGGEPEVVVSRLPKNTYSFDLDYDSQSLFYNHRGNSLIKVPFSSFPAVHNPFSFTNKHVITGISLFKHIQDFKVVGNIYYITLQGNPSLYSYDPDRTPPLQTFDSAFFYAPSWLDVYRPAYFHRHMASLPASVPNACLNSVCHQFCFVSRSSEQVCGCANDMTPSGSNCIGTGENANQPPDYGNTCPQNRIVFLYACQGRIPLPITPPTWTDDYTAPGDLILINTTIEASYSSGLHRFLYTAEDEGGLTGSCYFEINVKETLCPFDPSQEGEVMKTSPACERGDFTHNFTCEDPKQQIFYQGHFYPYLRNVCRRNGEWTVESVDGLYCSIPPTEAPKTTTTTITPRTTTTRRTTTQPVTQSTTTQSAKQYTTRSTTRLPTRTTTRNTPRSAPRQPTSSDTLPKYSLKTEAAQPRVSITQTTAPLLGNSAKRIQEPSDLDSRGYLAAGPVAAIVVVCVAVFIALLAALIVVARRKSVVPLSDNNNGFRLFWNNDERNSSKSDGYSLPDSS